MFSGSVLILNKYWQPLYIVSLEEAICLLFQERSKIILNDFGLLNFNDWINFSEEILSENPDLEYIKTAKKKLIRPYVLLMHKNNYQPRYEISFSRKLIDIRDKNRCQYCGKKLTKSDKTIDHIIPKSKGGKTEWENIVLCCRKCNQKKGNRTPKEAFMKLLNQPKRPKSIEIIMKKFENEKFFQLWKKFLEKPTF